MQTSNVNKICTARVKSRNFGFIQTWLARNYLGGEEASSALFWKCPIFFLKKVWLCPSLGWIFHSKCSFNSVFLTKCLLKCPSSMKPPLPWRKETCKRTTSVTVMVICFQICRPESYLITAIFQVPFQQLQGTLKTAF